MAKILAVDDDIPARELLVAILTPMGHDVGGMRCTGFITTLRRGSEWAATGKVTLPIPENFPTAEKTSSVAAK